MEKVVCSENWAGGFSCFLYKPSPATAWFWHRLRRPWSEVRCRCRFCVLSSGPGQELWGRPVRACGGCTGFPSSRYPPFYFWINAYGWMNKDEQTPPRSRKHMTTPCPQCLWSPSSLQAVWPQAHSLEIAADWSPSSHSPFRDLVVRAQSQYYWDNHGWGRMATGLIRVILL